MQINGPVKIAGRAASADSFAPLFFFFLYSPGSTRKETCVFPWCLSGALWLNASVVRRLRG